MDQLEAAFKALGRRVDVSIKRAAGRHSGGGPDRKRALSRKESLD